MNDNLVLRSCGERTICETVEKSWRDQDPGEEMPRERCFGLRRRKKNSENASTENALRNSLFDDRFNTKSID
ncbi:hypothetical protein RUM43_004847, partial [Polyplax serrata]